MDKDIFKVLDYLSGFTFGSLIDISPTINQIFPYKSDLSEDDFKRYRNRVTRFIQGMQDMGYVKYNAGGWSNIGEYDTNKTKWFDGFNGSIKFEALIQPIGLISLNQEKTNRNIKSTNRNTIKIILATLIVTIINAYITFKHNSDDNEKAQLNILLKTKSTQLDSLQSKLNQEQFLINHLLSQRNNVNIDNRKSVSKKP